MTCLETGKLFSFFNKTTYLLLFRRCRTKAIVSPWRIRISWMRALNNRNSDDNFNGINSCNSGYNCYSNGHSNSVNLNSINFNSINFNTINDCNRGYNCYSINNPVMTTATAATATAATATAATSNTGEELERQLRYIDDRINVASNRHNSSNSKNNYAMLC